LFNHQTVGYLSLFDSQYVMFQTRHMLSRGQFVWLSVLSYC